MSRRVCMCVHAHVLADIMQECFYTWTVTGKFDFAKDPPDPSPKLRVNRYQCLLSDLKISSFGETLIQWGIPRSVSLMCEMIREPRFSPLRFWCIPNDVQSVLAQFKAPSKPKVSITVKGRAPGYCAVSSDYKAERCTLGMCWQVLGKLVFGED